MTNPISQDGELRYLPAFINPLETDALFRRLIEEIVWQDAVMTDAGAWVKLPRSVRWYGDADAVYSYAGFTHHPRPWTEILLELKRQVEQACRQRFNGVLCNLYRDGREAMGWHADREAILGENPLIASLSLGAERLMRFRHERTGEQIELRLESGSLLIMGGCLQHHWLHSIPEMPEVGTARINLNFRSLIGVHSMPCTS
jgi:alkylated DNA repair dioxygenase AlkB